MDIKQNDPVKEWPLVDDECTCPVCMLPHGKHKMSCYPELREKLNEEEIEELLNDAPGG